MGIPSISGGRHNGMLESSHKIPELFRLEIGKMDENGWWFGVWNMMFMTFHNIWDNPSHSVAILAQARTTRTAKLEGRVSLHL